MTTQPNTLTGTLTMGLDDIDTSQFIQGEVIQVFERCERCGAQGFMRAQKVTENGETVRWTFCGNHGRKYLKKLLEQGYLIDDQTHRINEKPSVSANQD